MKLRIGMKVILTMAARDMYILNDKRSNSPEEAEGWIHRVGVVVEEYHHGGGKLYRVDFDPDVDKRSVWTLPGLCMKPTGREVSKWRTQMEGTFDEEDDD